MVDVKISELPAATAAHPDDRLEASQIEGAGWISKSVTLDQVTDFVADSDQIADVIDDAIGLIPAPTPPAWTDVSGKPTTFPPTTPIPYASISGTPTSLPPSGTAGGDLAGSYPNPTIKPGTNTQVLTTVGGVAAWAAPAGGGAGTVTTVSVVSANGLAGTVATPTATPAITLSTSVTGMLKGNGTAISAGTAGTDYMTPANVSTLYLPLAGGTLTGPLTGTTATMSGNLTHSTNSVTFGGMPSAAGFGGDTSNIAIRGYAAGAIYFQSAGGADTYGNASSAGWSIAKPLYLSAALSGTTATFTGTVMAPGALIQMVSTQTGAVATGTTIIPFDDTIPQITEGTEFMTLAITPKSATSKLIIEVTCCASVSTLRFVIVALFKDATANALAVTSQTLNNIGHAAPITLRHVMTSGTTSATTFRVRMGGDAAATITLNGDAGTRIFGGTYASGIVIREVAP